ncbi:hypothetical protein NDU88_003488 [Pleurodeles waltl]|uniref:Uncharacterized protein n=1 Tax=Pleurodeles waltl TaxID=8319 RepID=A0AAV7NKU2_PLEWA|nr:hypothetical protein NDU88_003488 [Pleurodeles waltl]
MDGYDLRITADYSKDTNKCQKAFLALRPRLRQLEMKYGLFDPTRICGAPHTTLGEEQILISFKTDPSPYLNPDTVAAGCDDWGPRSTAEKAKKAAADLMDG